jgi:putative sterol carrier protein
MSSCQEIFAAMAQVLSDAALSKKLGKRFKGSVNFTIATPSGDVTASLDLLSSPAAFSDSHLPKASITVSCSESDFVALLDGSLNPQEAFMKKKLKIKGKLGLAMKFNSVILATKKFLPKSKL